MLGFEREFSRVRTRGNPGTNRGTSDPPREFLLERREKKLSAGGGGGEVVRRFRSGRRWRSAHVRAPHVAGVRRKTMPTHERRRDGDRFETTSARHVRGMQRRDLSGPDRTIRPGAFHARWRRRTVGKNGCERDRQLHATATTKETSTETNKLRG